MPEPFPTIEPAGPDSDILVSCATRRGFLRSSLLLAGGFLLASPLDSMGFIFRPTGSTASSSRSRIEVPEEWVKTLGPQVRDYVAFIQRLRLRHIKIEQLIEAHMKRRGTVQNTIPPKKMWRSLVPTLKATDAVAARLGEPVSHIISAYRSPAYNARCPGARRNSFHVQNMALDLQFRSSPRRVAMVARELRERGHFTGGVGRYSGFTHIDTRGRKADW
jgi:uncharacterized protein YcbK (DUF882 family)